MSSCIATSQNRLIVDSVLAIMNTMFTYLTDSNSKKLTRAFLTQLGFGGLPDYESFGVRLSALSPLSLCCVFVLLRSPVHWMAFVSLRLFSLWCWCATASL